MEEEYRQIKIKAVLRMYSNRDPTLQLVRECEERTDEKDHQALVKEARAYAEEMGI